MRQNRKNTLKMNKIDKKGMSVFIILLKNKFVFLFLGEKSLMSFGLLLLYVYCIVFTYASVPLLTYVLTYSELPMSHPYISASHCIELRASDHYGCLFKGA